MNGKVKIDLDRNGNAIHQNTNNPDYGYIILSQKRTTIDIKGWVNNKVFTALIKGSIEDLKDSGIADMTELPGNIIVRESTTPFRNFNPNRDLKIAGDTGIILCTEDGEPIYRQTIYDGSGLMTDVLIPHANGKIIRDANQSTNNTKESTGNIGLDNTTDAEPVKKKRKRRTKAEMEAARALEAKEKEENSFDTEVLAVEFNEEIEAETEPIAYIANIGEEVIEAEDEIIIEEEVEEVEIDNAMFEL